MPQQRSRPAQRESPPTTAPGPGDSNQVPPMPQPRSRPAQRESPPTRAPRPGGSNQDSVPTAEPQQRQASPPAKAADAVHQQRPASPPVNGAGAVAPAQLAARAVALQESEEVDQLIPCQHCGRNFKPEVHCKHEGICQQVFQSKRKVYNTTDHRLPDDPVLAGVRKKAAQQARKGQVGLGDAATSAADKKNNNWRIKSEAFRAAMKDAQVVAQFQKEGRPLSELPAPAATRPELDDRVPCPHCGRRFGQQQAEKHIPSCASKKAKASAKGAARRR